jgi:O-antigen ligase
MFVFIFLLFFLIEGLGLAQYDKNFYLGFFLITPLVLYFYILHKKKTKIFFPTWQSFFYFLFVAVSLITTFLSAFDKQTAFEKSLIYFSLFLIFIFFSNFKELGKKIIHFLLLLGALLSLICLLLYLGNYFKIYLFPTSEKQFVWPVYAGHNHLGDFLGIGIIILIWQLIYKKRKINYWWLVVFFIFFILSFSRSAYLALIISLFLLTLYLKKKKYLLLWLILVLFLTAAALFVSANSDFFVKREIFSGRKEYLRQSVVVFRSYPILGIGAGNFIFASKMNNEYYIFSDSAHNIMAEIVVENGFVGLGLFCLFFLSVLYRGIKKKSLASVLLCYLLINFQTDYTYQIYTFLVLLMVFCALVVDDNYQEKIVNSDFFGGMALILYLIFLMILFSNFLVKINENDLAVKVYPYNKAAYLSLIKNATGKNEEESIKKMEKIAPYDQLFLVETADYYLRQNKVDRALLYFERFFKITKYIDVSLMEKIYLLKTKTQSKQLAEAFLQNVIFYWRKIPYSEPFAQKLRQFCFKIRGEPCYEAGWDKKP